jgi:hypothetical protein
MSLPVDPEVPSRAVPSDAARTVLALSLILGGAVTMAAIILLAYFHPAGYEHALFYFGIPLTMLTSGTAQVCIMVGLWLLWTVVYRRHLRRPPGWRAVKWTWSGVPTMWVLDETGRRSRYSSQRPAAD